MKKAVAIILIIFIMSLFYSVYAAEPREYEDTNMVSTIKVQSDKAKGDIEKYVEKYGSTSYGWAGYILDKIRWYSIPICLLGIAIRSNIPICYWYKKIRYEA